jgi:putative membrane protein
MEPPPSAAGRHVAAPDAAAPDAASADGDPARVARPSAAALPATPYGVRTVVTTYASGFLMGSADLVPGVSGGTIALVLGIYERLVANLRQGSRAAALLVRGSLRDAVRALGFVEWRFLVPLLLGVLTAVFGLARALEHLLESAPVLLSAGFFGLIVGSVAIAATELRERSLRILGVAAASAVVTFLLLGLRGGRFDDPGLVVVFAGGALAVTAMILPGISGSFILLTIGLYEFVLGAVSELRPAVLLAFAGGAVVGLGSFSTLLNWLLREAREWVLAVLVGLMAGSLRVLWPWPAEPDGVGTTTLGSPVAGEVLPAVAVAVAGAVFVVAVAALARRLSTADD